MDEQLHLTKPLSRKYLRGCLSARLCRNNPVTVPQGDERGVVPARLSSCGCMYARTCSPRLHEPELRLTGAMRG